jgi:hypothetical protein
MLIPNPAVGLFLRIVDFLSPRETLRALPVFAHRKREESMLVAIDEALGVTISCG